MENFEQVLSIVNEFYNIEQQNFGIEVFEVLKKVINFTSGYIFFANLENYEYAYNPQVKNFEDINGKFLVEDLKLKNTNFGKIVLTGDIFSDEERQIFKTCAVVISNITKDLELSKIIKMQLQSLQEGYIDVKKTNEKIKEAEELKSKFISHVSHELRTPINSILGFSEILSAGFVGQLNAKQKEYIEDIKLSSLRLLEMVNDVLDMSKIEAGAIRLNLRKFNIEPCINEVLNIISPLLQKKQIELQKEVSDFVVNADYQKLQQILFNLLSNAIKYTPEHGLVKISCKKNKEKTIISVEDNGVGIAKSDIAKIFDRFEQVGMPENNSTGLGLAIVKEFVNLHKGKISVESEIGKGSKFILEI